MGRRTSGSQNVGKPLQRDLNPPHGDLLFFGFDDGARCHRNSFCYFARYSVTIIFVFGSCY